MGFNYSPKIVTDGLVLYADPANNRSYVSGSTLLNDLSRSNNNGTLINGPIFDASNGGNIFLDGTNDYVDFGLASAGSATSNYTFSVWFKNDNSTETKYVLTRGRDGLGAGWSLYLSVVDTGEPFAGVVWTSPSVVGLSTPANTTVLSLNNWYYLTGVWKNGVGIYFYLDGVLNSSATTTGTSLRTSTAGWSLGTITTTNFTSGYYGPVQIYNRALTDDEILQNYNALKSRFPSVYVPPPVIPSFITSTNKLPVFGSGGGTYPPSGWTGLQNVTADDTSLSFTSTFNFTINNTNYSTHYIGSNTYITWGGGSSAYGSFSSTNPPYNKLFLGAADNSYQRVSTISTTEYVRVRYEGNGTTNGTLGSPGIVLEITIFNPANYDGQQIIEVLVGNHNRTSGVTGIANTTTYYRQWSMIANTSFVLVGNSTGTVWDRYLGYVNNSGY